MIMRMEVGSKIMLVDENGDYAGYRVEYPDWYYKLKDSEPLVTVWDI